MRFGVKFDTSNSSQRFDGCQKPSFVFSVWHYNFTGHNA